MKINEKHENQQRNTEKRIINTKPVSQTFDYRSDNNPNNQSKKPARNTSRATYYNKQKKDREKRNETNQESTMQESSGKEDDEAQRV